MWLCTACFIHLFNRNLLFSCVWQLLINEYDDDGGDGYQGHQEFPFWNLKIPPLSAKIPENSRYQNKPYMHIYKHKAYR